MRSVQDLLAYPFIPWTLRMFSIILGMFAIHALSEANDGRLVEGLFCVLVICLTSVGVLVWIMLLMTKTIDIDTCAEKIRKIELAYTAASGTLLLITGTFLLVGVIYHHKDCDLIPSTRKYCLENEQLGLLGAGLTLFQGTLQGIILGCVLNSFEH